MPLQKLGISARFSQHQPHDAARHGTSHLPHTGLPALQHLSSQQLGPLGVVLSQRHGRQAQHRQRVARSRLSTPLEVLQPAKGSLDISQHHQQLDPRRTSIGNRRGQHARHRLVTTGRDVQHMSQPLAHQRMIRTDHLQPQQLRFSLRELSLIQQNRSSPASSRYRRSTPTVRHPSVNLQRSFVLPCASERFAGQHPRIPGLV